MTDTTVAPIEHRTSNKLITNEHKNRQKIKKNKQQKTANEERTNKAQRYQLGT